MENKIIYLFIVIKGKIHVKMITIQIYFLLYKFSSMVLKIQWLN